MRDDYFKEALAIVDDPYTLVNLIWERVRMLRNGKRPLVEPLGKLAVEDIALREIIEGRVTHVSGDILVRDDVGDREDVVAPTQRVRAFPVQADLPGQMMVKFGQV
jgi:DNA-directed RNA polymerase subunit omega